MEEEIKELSALERQKKGRALNDLSGKFIKKELDMAIAKFSSFGPIETEISVGDLVLISQGNPLEKNISGIVTEKKSKAILVAFSGIIPDWAFDYGLRMDLYVNDVTFSRMESNLKNLSREGICALVFLLKHIPCSPDRKKKKIVYSDESLNQFQKNAISKSLISNNFFLIHGPFGTGKTKTLIELIAQEVKNNHKVLVTAESNAAVDNIVERLAKSTDLRITRLGHPQKVSKETTEHTLISQIERHELYKKVESAKKEVDNLFKKMSKEMHPTRNRRCGLSDAEILTNANLNKGTPEVPLRVMKSMAKWIQFNTTLQRKLRIIRTNEKKIVDDILNKSQVILTTNSSAALEEVSRFKFDVAIIDEASQTTIPSILIPISKAKRFILAGDHKQLPPTVLSTSAKELEITLFEKLIELYPDRKQLLNVQFRMNKLLMDFPNSEFYNNELICDESVKDISLNVTRKKLDIDSPLVFIDTSSSKKAHERKLKYSKSYINTFEADLALEISEEYLKLGFQPDEIGIISPYADQVNYIKNRTEVEVKSVDGFQGREKEIIIISTVRSNKRGNIGFLSDLRRLNVAITRGKRKLIIIGNSKTLKHDDTYKRLIDFCEEKSLIVKV